MRTNLLLGAMFAICGQALAADHYTVQGLGVLNAGDNRSGALGLNNLGDVVGWSGSSLSDNDLPFVYSHITHTMTQVAFTGDRTAGSAWAINDSGSIVGAMGLANNSGQNLAFVSDGTTSSLIGGLPGYANGGAHCINNAGQIGGECYNGSAHNAGFRYSGGTFTELDASSSTDVTVGGIMADGRMVGYDQGKAWISDTGTSLTNFDLKGRVYGVNDSGDSVGIAKTGTFKPTLWTASGVHSTLPGSFTPDDINNNGVVVGSTSTGYDDIFGAAFVYKDGVTSFLDDLNLTDGWVLHQALAINDSNQIVGTGTFNGQNQAFIATLAVPEPAPFACLGLGLLILVRRRRV